MDQKMHRRRARRAWPELVKAAKLGEPVSYKDLTAALGLVMSEQCGFTRFGQGSPRWTASSEVKRESVQEQARSVHKH